MIKGEYFVCPKCGTKLFKIKSNFIIKGIQVKCKRCKTILDIDTSQKEPI